MEFLLSQTRAANPAPVEQGAEAASPKPDTIGTDLPTGLVYLDPSSIDPNPYQPRLDFDEDEIAMLAESIRSQGLLQPIVVRKRDRRFELIAGERRLRAVRKAGIAQIPALLREVDEPSLRLLALVENLQRQDLNPIEKAHSFDELRRQTGWTQEELAAQVGLKRSSVANYQRLLELDPKLQDEVRRGRLSMGHARALLTAPEAGRATLAKVAIDNGLSVRRLEELATEAQLREAATRPTTGRGAPAVVAPKGPRKAAWARDMEDNLRGALGCRVGVRFRGGRGRIVLEIGSREEFDRIYELLMECLPHDDEDDLVARKVTRP
ncbi:MAG: ParB/RepB/Spo0J family partition protein [Planctomycetota bacterium]